jgi:hypothetical protein
LQADIRVVPHEIELLSWHGETEDQRSRTDIMDRNDIGAAISAATEPTYSLALNEGNTSSVVHFFNIHRGASRIFRASIPARQIFQMNLT